MKQCSAVHKLMNARCVQPDDGDAHKDMGHKADFEGADYHWRPTVDEWERWQDSRTRWPEYDCDPTRRSSPVELWDRVAHEVLQMGHSRLSAQVKVVVATGSPQTPFANILALAHGTLPDGTPVVVLEL